MTWKDCPVECASLFHSRVKKFLHDYILSRPCILGRVNEYVVCYEIQFRGSLHAHIMLWIEYADLERVANEITTSVSAVFDSTSGNFIEPTDTEQNTLFKTVMRKQLPTCTSQCHHRKSHGTCKYGFPFPPHTEEQTTYNIDTRDGITIDPAMKTAILCHTTQPFCYFGVHISICKELIQLIGRTTC